jgi:hypothetical protein
MSPEQADQHLKAAADNLARCHWMIEAGAAISALETLIETELQFLIDMASEYPAKEREILPLAVAWVRVGVSLR